MLYYSKIVQVKTRGIVSNCKTLMKLSKKDGLRVRRSKPLTNRKIRMVFVVFFFTSSDIQSIVKESIDQEFEVVRNLCGSPEQFYI